MLDSLPASGTGANWTQAGGASGRRGTRTLSFSYVYKMSSISSIVPELDRSDFVRPLTVSLLTAISRINC